MVVLDVVDNMMHYHLELTERFSVIREDKDLRRIGLYGIVKMSRRDDWVKIELTGLTEAIAMIEAVYDLIPSKHDAVLLFDEPFFRQYQMLISYYKTYAVENNLYFVIRSRIDLYGAIYDLVEDKGRYVLSKLEGYEV